MQPSRKHVVLINLADFGRSPRAQLHARSFLSLGWRVTVLGHACSELYPELARNDGLQVVDLFELFGGRTRPANRYLQAVREAGLLRLALKDCSPQPDLVFVVTPPAFPVFREADRFSRKNSIAVLVDWHNLGFSRIEKRKGQNHPLTRLYRWLEFPAWLGGEDRGDFEPQQGQRVQHIAVSRALAHWLQQHGGVKHCAVLYDHPPQYRRVAERVRSDFLAGVADECGCSRAAVRTDSRWLVYPSSWSDEESPEMLLDVLADLEQALQNQSDHAQLDIFLTGTGPLREDFMAAYEQVIKDQHRAGHDKRVRLHFPNLSPVLYFELLAQADAGLCFHSSTSGLDLPMKLADFRGAGLPCLIYDYGTVLQEVAAWHEDAIYFASSAELLVALCVVAGDRPTEQQAEQVEQDQARRAPGRKNTRTGSTPYWETSWRDVVEPMLSNRCS